MWTRIVAILALIFGLATILSGGNVLFGPDGARALAGDYVPFVVWFNFLAGFVYVIAAIGIWSRQGWAGGLSVALALATALVALAFGVQVMRGAPFEMRTVGALVLRFAFWAAIAIALLRARRSRG